MRDVSLTSKGYLVPTIWPHWSKPAAEDQMRFGGSMATNAASFQPDSDVHITYEDQQKINMYARHNAKLEDLKEELKAKQNELKNLEDAADELELADYAEDEKILFSMGEVYVYNDMDTTMKTLEELKVKLTSALQDLETKCSELRKSMNAMKPQLYAKFGNHINLEPDDE